MLCWIIVFTSLLSIVHCTTTVRVSSYIQLAKYGGRMAGQSQHYLFARHYNDSNGRYSVKAYSKHSNLTVAQIIESPGQRGDNFGYQVASNERFLAVLAPGVKASEQFFAGLVAVYIYEMNTTNYENPFILLQKLESDGERRNVTRPGYLPHVDMNSENIIAVVGLSQHDPIIHIFNKHVSTDIWHRTQMINDTRESLFGDLALKEQLCTVSYETGNVKIYSRRNRNFDLVQAISGNHASSHEFAIKSIGEDLYVGNGGEKNVKLYSLNVTDDWALSQIMSPPQESTITHFNSNNSFGARLDISGRVMVISAPQFSFTDGEVAGAVFVYELNSTSYEWEHKLTLREYSSNSFGLFGRWVLVDEERIYIYSGTKDYRIYFYKHGYDTQAVNSISGFPVSGYYEGKCDILLSACFEYCKERSKTKAVVYCQPDGYTPCMPSQCGWGKTTSWCGCYFEYSKEIRKDRRYHTHISPVNSISGFPSTGEYKGKCGDILLSTCFEYCAQRSKRTKAVVYCQPDGETPCFASACGWGKTTAWCGCYFKHSKTIQEDRRYHTHFSDYTPETTTAPCPRRISSELGTSQISDNNGAPGEDVRVNTEEKDAERLTIGFSTSLAVLLVVCCAIAVVLWNRTRNKFAPQLAPDPEWEFDPDRSMEEQVGELPYNLSFEFPRLDVTLKRLIGEGHFGEVWEATAEGISAFRPKDDTEIGLRSKLANIYAREHNANDFWVKYFRQVYYPTQYSDEGKVAVKCLKPGAPEKDYTDLANELKLLIHIGRHKNIVNLMGACTQKGPLWIILEYCPNGDLRRFLHNKQINPTWNRLEIESTEQICFADLARIAMEIAEGMIFLSTIGVIHRDLAARNVLVGINFEMKVADFGRARNVGREDEEYNKESETAVPVRWTSPEAMNVGIYSTASDVWSYGIVLWEIFSMGSLPYGGMSNFEVKQLVERGERLEAPRNCPDDMHVIMEYCWNEEAKKRPSFLDIFEILMEVRRNPFAPSADYYSGAVVSARADIYTSDKFVDCGPALRDKRVKWLKDAGVAVTEENVEELLERMWGTQRCGDEIDKDRNAAGPSYETKDLHKQDHFYDNRRYDDKDDYLEETQSVHEETVHID